MATPQEIRMAELRAKLIETTPRIAPPAQFPLQGIGGAIGVNGETTEMLMVEVSPYEFDTYEAWLARLELSDLEALMHEVEQYNSRGAAAENTGTDMSIEALRGPLNAAPENVVSYGRDTSGNVNLSTGPSEGPVEVQFEIPDMRKELIKVTFQKAEQELKQVIEETKQVPDYLKLFTKLEGEARIAVERLFTDPEEKDPQKKDISKRAQPIYRGYKNADGSLKQGEIIVRYPDGKEEPLQAYLEKQPDTLVAPVVQALSGQARGPAPMQQQQAQQQQAQAAGANPPEAPAAESKPATKHNYLKVYENSLHEAEVTSRRATGTGVGLGATVATTALLLTFGVAFSPILPVVAGIAGTMLGRALGAAAPQSWRAQEDALDEVATLMVLDLAKLPPEKREEQLEKDISKLGYRAAKKYFGAQVEIETPEGTKKVTRAGAILDMAARMPQSRTALDVLDKHMDSREAARAAAIGETEKSYRNKGKVGAAIGSTLVIAAPEIATLSLGIPTAIVAPALGLLFGSKVGGTIGEFLGGSASRNRGAENANKVTTEWLIDLSPEARREAMKGMEQLLPSSEFKALQGMVEKAGDKRIERADRARANTQEITPRAQEAPAAVRTEQPSPVVNVVPPLTENENVSRLAEQSANLGSAGQRVRENEHTQSLTRGG